MDAPTTELLAQRGAFLVANLVAYYAMRARAAEFGMTSEMLAKNDLVIDGGLRSFWIGIRTLLLRCYTNHLRSSTQMTRTVQTWL